VSGLHGDVDTAAAHRPPGTGGGLRALPPAVRWLAAAWVLASTADSFLLFALFWIAGPQGWSGAEIAAMVLAVRLPALLGGALGGYAVDRFGPRRLMLIDLTGRTALMIALAIAGWGGEVSLLAVLVLGGPAGALFPVSYAGARTLVPRLTAPDQWSSANALLAVGDQLPLLLGAALVGPAVALAGVGPALLVPAGLLATAAWITARLPRTATPTANPAASDPTDRDRPPWRTPRVVALVALSVAYYAAYGPFEPVLAAFSRDQLHGGALSYGVLWSVFGVGALLTLPTAPWLALRRPGMVNALGALTWGLVTIPLAFTGNLLAAAVVFLISGLVWGPYSTVEATALQRWTAARHHGRVFGVQRALLSSATPLGAAVGGIALDHLSSPTIIVLSAGACALAGGTALLSRELRTGH
jgi:predicted MFS family arabinose efflux permease